MASIAGMKARGFVKTGLRAIYPTAAKCPHADSLFATETRGDGSIRNERFFNGYHSGMDIPVAEGTPVLAIAAGTVVHKKVGKHIGGIAIYLQHTPQDTGLSVWSYSEYKHLKTMPDIGATGTKGGHYGAEGHPHLHLSTFISPDDTYVARRLFFPPNGQWVDPLALYQQDIIESEKVRKLPKDRKRVAIPYQTNQSVVLPKNSKLIWPFACIRRDKRIE